MADEVSADEDYSLVSMVVADSIQMKLAGVSPVSRSCSVFRVREVVRKRDIYAYRPSAISIGPLHRYDDGNEYLFMENVKRLYLQSMLPNCETDLLRLVRAVTKIETQARQCYADDLDHISSEDFVEMLVIDGCFVVEFLHRQLCVIENIRSDPVSRIYGLRHTIYQDLVLLENQLPWCVLENLYTELRMSTGLHNDCREFSLTDLVINLLHRESGFQYFMIKPKSELSFQSALHILDVIRGSLISAEQSKFYGCSPIATQDSKHHEYEGNYAEKIWGNTIPNAVALSEVGIEFKKGTRACIMDIEFKNGVFTIPPFEFRTSDVRLFSNMIAFEECSTDCRPLITSHLILMNNLITSSKDVELLAEKGILINSKATVEFLNKVSYNIIFNVDTTKFSTCYWLLDKDVRDYYRDQLDKCLPKKFQWMKVLKHDYFGTPWKVVSLIAAFALLLLTLLQTIYTMKK